MEADTFDFICLMLTIGIFVLYHLYLYCFFYFPSFFQNQNALKLSQNMFTVHYWIKKHMLKVDPASTVTVIQTFRNVNLVAVFTAAIAFSAFDKNRRRLDSDDGFNEALVRAIISSMQLCSVLAFACVIRFASHLGYLIGVFATCEDEQLEEVYSKVLFITTGKQSSAKVNQKEHAKLCELCLSWLFWYFQ